MHISIKSPTQMKWARPLPPAWAATCLPPSGNLLHILVAPFRSRSFRALETLHEPALAS